MVTVTLVSFFGALSFGCSLLIGQLVLAELVQRSFVGDIAEPSPLIPSVQAVALLDSVPLYQLVLAALALPKGFNIPVRWRLTASGTCLPVRAWLLTPQSQLVPGVTLKPFVFMKD